MCICRVLHNSIPWPVWSVALAPDFTLFWPIDTESQSIYGVAADAPIPPTPDDLQAANTNSSISTAESNQSSNADNIASTSFDDSEPDILNNDLNTSVVADLQRRRRTNDHSELDRIRNSRDSDDDDSDDVDDPELGLNPSGGGRYNQGRRPGNGSGNGTIYIQLSSTSTHGGGTSSSSASGRSTDRGYSKRHCRGNLIHQATDNIVTNFYLNDKSVVVCDVVSRIDCDESDLACKLYECDSDLDVEVNIYSKNDEKCLDFNFKSHEICSNNNNDDIPDRSFSFDVSMNDNIEIVI